MPQFPILRLCLLLGCLSGPARAVAQAPADEEIPLQPLSAAITVQAGKTCLDEARLERRTMRWLEREQVDARIRVDVIGGDGPTDVRFVVHRQGEEPAHRKLQSVPEPCDQMHSAVALSVALSIDATLLGGQQVSDEEALGPEPPEEEEGQEPPVLPEPPPGPNAYLPMLTTGLLGGVSSGMVPGVAPAGRLSVGFSPVRWFELRLGGIGTASDGFAFEGVPGSYRAWLAAGRLDLCFLAAVGDRFRFGVCTGGEAGYFGTRGQGFPAGDQRASTPWVAAFAGLSGWLRLSGALGLGAEVALHAPLQSRTLLVVVEDGADFARFIVSPVGLCAAIGPVLHFDL